MKVEIYFSKDCPNLQATVDLVREVATENDFEVDLEIKEITSDEEWFAMRLQGSPTVQVEGFDIEPQAREGSGNGPSCRLYGGSGVPSRKLIEDALLGRGEK
jgi:hypothetical protein